MKPFKIRSFLFVLFGQLTLSLLISCTHKTDIPTPINQDPEFSVLGVIGSDSIKLIAGIDDYFMNTFYNKDANGVFVLNGELKKQNCTNCLGDLQIGFYDSETRPSANITDIGKVLSSGVYGFATQTVSGIIPSNQIQFNAEVTGKSFLWRFGDGDSSLLANPTHNYTTGKRYIVCLTVNDTMRNTTVCDSIIVNDTQNCNVQFDMSGSTLNRTFTATSGKSNYQWSFGDGTGVVNTPTAAVNHIYSSVGVYHVRLFANNNTCSSTFEKDVVINTLDTAASAFHYLISPGVPATDLNYSKAMIRWVNSSGKVYSTLRSSGKQPSASMFSITSSSPYKKDSKGNATYTVTGGFNAFLYNESNPLDSVLINSAKFKIAVGYPQ